jgi:hypothetical protein
MRKFFDFLICHYCQTKIHGRGITDNRHIWKKNYCCGTCFEEQMFKEKNKEKEIPIHA